MISANKPIVRKRAITPIRSSKNLTNNSYKDEEKRVGLIETRLRKYGANFDHANDVSPHMDDKYNTPEVDGEVVVNIGSQETTIHVAKQIGSMLKPHQIGGIRFLYDNLIGSVKDFDPKGGYGCILAHSMGLGKTVQMIALIDIFLSNHIGQTVLIVTPLNVLQNWDDEFGKWLPNNKIKIFGVDKLSGAAIDRVINTWKSMGGVLLIGYEKYLSITSNAENPNDSQNKDNEILSALRDPGPDMVILDEGHRIKNPETKVNKSLKKIATHRKVILTGYPFQNNMEEYYSMIDFVRPGYLGSPSEFRDQFGGPIKNGQLKDALREDKTEMKKQNHILGKILRGIIQR